MNVKKLARYLLPPIAIAAAKYSLGRMPKTKEQMLQEYLKNGRIPWSPGYIFYHSELMNRVLADKSLLERFRRAEPLPDSYGVGIDERCIEYPWLLAQLPASAQCLLDAGSTLNHEFVLDHPALNNKKLHILTLAPEGYCFWLKGVSYLYDDLRDIPIRNDYYDAIICLSTLEHIGCDNTLYTRDERDRENRPDDFVLAVKELRRVLKPGGLLFLSVPFGAYRHLGTAQQFDRSLLSHAIDAFGTAREVVEAFYRYTADGWQLSTAADCAECEYVEWITKLEQHQQLPDPVPIEPDLAAAARAVACVRLVKE